MLLNYILSISLTLQLLLCMSIILLNPHIISHLPPISLNTNCLVILPKRILSKQTFVFHSIEIFFTICVVHAVKVEITFGFTVFVESDNYGFEFV